MTLDIKSNELEQKFMKEQISTVEKRFTDISSKMSSYVKKLAALRDSGDEVAKSISDFASDEKCNQTLRLSMGEFSDVLYSIQEYREAEVNRIQIRVVHELDKFTPLCKHAKVEMKKCFDSREKLLKRKTELEKMRSKSPPNWQKIAEKEVNQAQCEAAHTTQELAKQVEHFERTKIEDLKKMFLEFVKIEMIFHAKAIELYTKSYTILANIEVEEDLKEFKSYFRALHCATNLAAPQTEASQETMPKVIDAQEDNSPSQFQVLKGYQGPKRSIFTLRNDSSQMSNSSLNSLTDHLQSQIMD